MTPSRYDEQDEDDVPDLDDIRSMCSDKLFKEAMRSYERGDIIKAYIEDGEIEASIYDSDDKRIHEVGIDIEIKYSMYARCTCETASMYGTMCKHVIATLLHMNNDSGDTDLYDDVTEETVNELLEKASPEQIRSFLTSMISDNKSMLHRFITENGLKSEYSISKYSGSLTALYNNADKTDGKIDEYLDFADQFDEARKTRREGKHEDAAQMYKTISEAISDRMDIVKDDSGYYADCFIEALEGMVECILRERMQHEKKTAYISYLFEKSTSPNGARFARYYRDALESICITDEDLDMWQGLVSIPQDVDESNKGIIAEMLRMKYHISKRFGQYSEVIALLAKHHSLHSDICILYLKALRLQQLKHQQSTTAISKDDKKGSTIGNSKTGTVTATTTAAITTDTNTDTSYTFPKDAKILEAAYVFPDSSEVLEAAYAVLSDDSKDRATILERLYAITGDWNYIIRRKHILPDWYDARDTIIKGVSAISSKNAVTLCIKEDMHDMAMSILESGSDMELLAHFKSKLIRKSFKRYVTCYANTLTKFAGSKSNKDHYKRVKNYLITLKDMPKCTEQYESTIKAIRKKYAGRRVLIKEISSI